MQSQQRISLKKNDPAAPSYGNNPTKIAIRVETGELYNFTEHLPKISAGLRAAVVNLCASFWWCRLELSVLI